MNIRSKLCISLCLLALLTCLPLNVAALGAAPSQAGKKVISGGQRDFAFPVPGHNMLSSCFYDNRNHCALDFPAPKGTPIVASYAGTVIATYNGCSHNYGKSSSCGCGSGFGNYVVLKHDYVLKGGEHITLYSSYNHLTKATVSEGQTVRKGQQVGTMGSTGYSTGHHLDFQILLGGWTPFRQHSIDPYINELLELPEGLHSMNSGGCCSKYVAYVKEYYPRCLHDNFNAAGSCTGCGYTFDFASTRSAAAMGIYTANADTSLANKPYTASLGSAGTLKAGAEVSVSATVTNGAGESWYQLENGGYLPKSTLTFVRYRDAKIEGSISTPAEGQTLKKQSYTLSGSITSLYPLKKVSGYIDGTHYGSWTGSATSLSLTGTDINNKLFFAALAPGKHTLTVTATDSTGRGETTVIQRIFYIEQPPVYHAITLSLDGGSCEAETLSILHGSTIGQLPVPTKEGHTFAGWYTESGEAVTADTIVTAPITLLARWDALSYTVLLGETQFTAAYGQPLAELPQLQQEGMHFLGWFTQEEGGSEFTAETPVTGDLTLYPRWEGLKYQVTLDPDGGAIAWRRKNVTFGGNYGVIPDPTRNGYRFIGWSIGSSLITKTTPVVTAEDHILTAVWQPLETVPVVQEEAPASQSPIWIIPVGLAGLLAAAAVFFWHRQREDVPADGEETIPEEVEAPAEESPAEEAEVIAEESPAEDTEPATT